MPTDLKEFHEHHDDWHQKWGHDLRERCGTVVVNRASDVSLRVAKTHNHDERHQDHEDDWQCKCRDDACLSIRTTFVAGQGMEGVGR